MAPRSASLPEEFRMKRELDLHSPSKPLIRWVSHLSPWCVFLGCLDLSVQIYQFDYDYLSELSQLSQNCEDQSVGDYYAI